MPLTLIELLSVFVSTLTITAIALDRYQLIVYPTKDVLKRIGAIAGIFFIWINGFCLASPIFVFRTLEHHNLDYRQNQTMENDVGVYSIDYWYVHHE